MAFFNKEKIEEKSKRGGDDLKRHTLLLVDDEEANLRSLRGLLEGEYHLLLAKDGQEALNLIKSYDDPAQIHLIISDQRMPHVSGVEFLTQTISIIPQAIRVILTGYTDVDALINAINDGHIYRFITKPYDPKELKISVQRALEAYELEEKRLQLNRVFEKFVPKQLLSWIAPQGLKHIEYGQAKDKKLTILFSDIRSFTSLSETMNPQELINFINTYLQRMSAPIHKHHGFISKFIGDGIIALFERSNESKTEHAEDAVRAAIAMQEAVELYNQTTEDLPNQKTPIEIGIGIHSGNIVTGTVGTKDRMDSTILGDNVNLASHLEELTKTYQTKILISETTYQLVDPQQFHIREVDTPRIKGKIESITIYEVFDADLPKTLEKKLATRQQLTEGIQLFNTMKFQQANECFQECLSQFPKDVVANQYIRRGDYLNKYYYSQGKEFNPVLKKFGYDLLELMKRQFHRFDYLIPVNLYLMDQKEHYAAHLIDISKSGVRIETNWKIELFTTLVLEVSLYKESVRDFTRQKPLRILGRIVWKFGKEIDGEGFIETYGIEFIQLSPLDRDLLYAELEKIDIYK